MPEGPVDESPALPEHAEDGTGMKVTPGQADVL